MTLLLGLIALGLSYLLPGHYVPWSAFEQQALAAAALGLIGFSVFEPRRSSTCEVSWFAWIVIACAAIPLMQGAIGQITYRADATLSSLYVGLLFIALVVGRYVSLSRPAPFIDGLSWVFIASGVVSVVLASLQWWGGVARYFIADLMPGGRPFANLAQPNHLATLLALSLTGVLILYERRRLVGVAAAAIAATCAFGLLLTQSRTAWVFAVLIIVWRVAAGTRAKVRIGVAPIVIAVALFAAAVSQWDKINDLLLLSSATDLEQRLQGGTRTIHWQTLWDAAWKHPWTGYGWSQVGFAQQLVALDHPASGEWLTSSHSLLLDLMIWNGIPIGLLLFTSIVIWFVLQVRACRSSEQWALLVGVGAIFIHALLEFPLEFTYFLVPLGLMMGALDAMNERAPSWSIPRMAFALPFVLVLGVAGWVVKDYLVVQQAATQLRFNLLGYDLERTPTVAPPDVKLLDSLREQHAFWNIKPDPGMSDADLALMRRVALRFGSMPTLQRYALAMGLNGNPDEAGRALTLICKTNPDWNCISTIKSWESLQLKHEALRAVPPPRRELAGQRAPRSPSLLPALPPPG